jgi:nucleotide-binding universal stress UspA family protein
VFSCDLWYVGFVNKQGSKSGEQVKILLATDGSEHSEGAARFLTRLNLSSEDEITIFHAIYCIPCLYGREFYYDTLEAMKKEIAPRTLDSAMDILKSVKARISTLILDGSPDHCIIDASVESDTDLIVIGARGIKASDSYFIGSVTRAVAIQSPKPVLVINNSVNISLRYN